MSKNQKKKVQVLVNKKEVELHPNELALVLALRKYPYGEIVIMMRDGVPQRFKKVEIFEDLNKYTVDNE
jgi:hypothetical protein